MRVCLALGAVSLALLLGFSTAVSASETDQFNDFSELTLEDLLDQPVITASRSSQELRDSPLSITVITREELLRSGATNIPEALRMIPGLEVLATAPGGYDVSARGMGENGANTMLVMVDGRSVYADYYGLTLWEFLPNDLSEIASIEVIRGPGSALYGANAFAGVINVITVQPEDSEGTTGRVVGGTPDTNALSLVHASNQGPVAYKVSAGLETVSPRLDPSDDRATEIGRLNAAASYEVGERGTLRFSGGYTNGQTQTVPTSFTGGVDFDGHAEYLRADYQAEKWWIRGFWNRSAVDIIAADLSIPVGVFGLDEAVHDLEMQREFGPTSHRLIVGGNVRHKSVEWRDQDSVDQTLVAGFVQQEYAPTEKWSLSAGLRYDDHPLVDGHLAPRFGVVFKPSRRHVIRASGGQAFRNPAYVENYWSTTVSMVPGFDAEIGGDKSLESESIRSIELGYQGLFRDDLMAAASVYRNEVRDIISLGVAERYASPPAPIPGLPSRVTFFNGAGFDATGVEAELTFDPTAAWRAHLSYSYVHATDSENGTRVERIAAHRAGLDMGVRFGLFDLASRLHYVSASTWSVEVNGIPSDSPAGDYVSVDLRLGLSLSSNRQFAIGVTNLLDRNYRDYGAGYENERRVTASVLFGL